jgi:dihydroorotase
MMRNKVQIMNTACDAAFENRVLNVLSDLGIGVSNSQYAVFPGFCDVHVHFREPGFSYKETIFSGCLAAARGGYTAVCTMPNLNPAPDTAEHLRQQLQIIEKDAAIHVYPYGTITMGENGEALSDMDAMAQEVCGFSDDGRGVQNTDMMVLYVRTGAL